MSDITAPHPLPPAYLVDYQLEEMCQGHTFGSQVLMQFMLKLIVRRTLNGQITTEDLLADLWRTAEPEVIYEDVAVLWQKVRVNVGRLRKLINRYYKSLDAQTPLILISIPRAGVDALSRKLIHYTATFFFNPLMLHNANVFAGVLHYKYDLPLEEGVAWFETKQVAPSLSNLVSRMKIKRAALLGLFGTLFSEDNFLAQTSKWPEKWRLDVLWALTQPDAGAVPDSLKEKLRYYDSLGATIKLLID